MGYININGTDLYYEEMGKGKPVFLLNGIFMSTKSWYPESSVLSKKYRVILHDFRGQWQSKKPEGKYTFGMHADDLYQLVKKLKLEKIHLIGTSYGGEVAMTFAIKYRDLLKSLLIITSVSEIDLHLKLIAERWKNAVRTKNVEIFINEWLGDTYSENFLKSNLDAIYPRLIEAFKVFDFNAGEKLIDCFLELYKNPLTPYLNKINISTAVIASELDTLKPPKYSRIIHNEIKNSEFHIIQNSGHAVVIEKPEEINTILLEFLEKAKMKQD
jgi:3-oxoadipate enol-lactonase